MPEFPTDLTSFLKFAAEHAPWRQKGCRYAKHGCVMRKVAVDFSDKTQNWTILLDMADNSITMYFHRAYFDPTGPSARICIEKNAMHELSQSLYQMQPQACQSLKDFHNHMGGNHGLSKTSAHELFDAQHGLCDFVRPINQPPVELVAKEESDESESPDPMAECVKRSKDRDTTDSWCARFGTVSQRERTKRRLSSRTKTTQG